MASQKSAGGSGCALLIIVSLGIWLALWALKLALIIGGGVLVVGGVAGAVATVIWAWAAVFADRRVDREDEALREVLDELSTLSTTSLREQIVAWDRIQEGRGVGTVLESAYWSEQPTDEQATLFARVNTLMSRGEQLLTSRPGSRRAVIDHLRECDRLTLDLSELQDRIRSV
jgi:hypothetical protein